MNHKKKAMSKSWWQMKEKASKIIESYEKQRQKQEKEKNRIKDNDSFWSDSISEGQIVAGVDEVTEDRSLRTSRSSFIIWPNSNTVIENEMIEPRKTCLGKKEQLYDLIVKKSLYCSIGMIENDVIDKINILNATFRL